MNIFTIFDTKAKAYMQPFFSKNAATALREVQSAVDNTEHGFNTHAEDYSLFHIGNYDENSGKIDPISPTHIINLVELKQVNIPSNVIPINNTEDN